MNLAEWSDAKRIISPEVNPAEHGQWRTSRAEFQRGIMNAISDDRYAEVVFMKSSRVGWTSIIENFLGYLIDYDPGPTMMVLPTVEDAQWWSKDSLASLLRDTPSLQGKVKEARTKNSDNTILHKKFPGGYLMAIGSNSPRGFRRVTIRYLLCDEIDGWAESSGSEGDPLILAKRRTATVHNRKILIGSTPTVAGGSKIEFDYAASNQQHYYVPCPHCNTMQVLSFNAKYSMFGGENINLGEGMEIIGNVSKGYVHYDAENLSYAHYICEHCKKEIDEKEKSKMIEKGEWRALNPLVTSIAGFHISEMYSTFNSTWLDMARDFVKAKLRQEKLRVFVNQRLGETFKAEEEMFLSETFFLTRIEPYEKIPSKVLCLTAGVDVQGDRVEVVVKGWSGEPLANEDESWLVDYKVLWGATLESDVWRKLDDYLQTTFETEDEVQMKIECAFIDSGYNTHEVYRFTRPRESRRIFSTKGKSGTRPLISSPYRDKTTKARVYTLGVDEAKQKIYDRLRKTEGPGTMHFNALATEEYLRQLTAEKFIARTKRWEKKITNARNEALDCEVYAFCAFVFLAPNFKLLSARRKKMLEEIKSTPEQKPMKQTKPIVRNVKRNWVTEW